MNGRHQRWEPAAPCRYMQGRSYNLCILPVSIGPRVFLGGWPDASVPLLQQASSGRTSTGSENLLLDLRPINPDQVPLISHAPCPGPNVYTCWKKQVATRRPRYPRSTLGPRRSSLLCPVAILHFVPMLLQRFAPIRTSSHPFAVILNPELLPDDKKESKSHIRRPPRVLCGRLAHRTVDTDGTR